MVNVMVSSLATEGYGKIDEGVPWLRLAYGPQEINVFFHGTATEVVLEISRRGEHRPFEGHNHCYFFFVLEAIWWLSEKKKSAFISRIERRKQRSWRPWNGRCAPLLKISGPNSQNSSEKSKIFILWRPWKSHKFLDVPPETFVICVPFERRWVGCINGYRCFRLGVSNARTTIQCNLAWTQLCQLLHQSVP